MFYKGSKNRRHRQVDKFVPERNLLFSGYIYKITFCWTSSSTILKAEEFAKSLQVNQCFESEKGGRIQACFVKDYRSVTKLSKLPDNFLN